MKTLQTKITYIYSLVSSDEPDRVRYIGKSDTPNVRLKKHIQESKRIDSTHKHKWINKKISEGYTINMKILKIVEHKFWEDAEIFFINAFSDCDLTNFANGGNGGCPSKYSLTYNEVKSWVQKNIKAKSSVDWFKLAKKIKYHILSQMHHMMYTKNGLVGMISLEQKTKNPRTTTTFL